MPQLHLKLLEPHRTALEKCVYCPKLCRAACPVSNAEASETVTPWGKASLAYFAGRGDVPLDSGHAASAWACSACAACRERCDHKNEVGTVLNDARAEYFARGVAPAAAQAVAYGFRAREAVHEAAIEALDRGRARPAGKGVKVLLGCGYVRYAPEVARDALDAVEALVGAPVKPVHACCGLPLLYAGDRAGFVAAARRLAAEVEPGERFVAVDPGCARAVRVEYSRASVVAEPPELFVDLVLDAKERLRRSSVAQRVRYHDPCQLGRGLDRYDAPREILACITGQKPEEFVHRRELGDCSGGGGLLPATRPATSAAIGNSRLAEHRALGGGLLVTHCAQSLRRFRSCGEPAEDLASLVARAIAPR